MIDPDIYKVPDDIPSIPSDSDFEDDTCDEEDTVLQSISMKGKEEIDEVELADNISTASASLDIDETSSEGLDATCWEGEMYAEVTEDDRSIQLERCGVDETDEVRRPDTEEKTPSKVRFSEKVEEITVEEIVEKEKTQGEEEGEVEEFPPLTTSIEVGEEKKISRNKKKKLKKQKEKMKKAATYRDMLLRNLPENFVPKKLAQPANDRKSPVQFCQKLREFIKLKPFNDDKLVNTSRLEEFIQEKYSDELDDEDLHVLEKICAGDVGCFQIFDSLIGQHMNVRFCFTKPVEDTSLGRKFDIPTSAEVEGFLTLLEMRIEEICMHLRNKVYTGPKLAAIASAVIWDTRLPCFQSMINYIVRKDYTWRIFQQRLGRYLACESTRRGPFFKPRRLLGYDFFELLLEDLEKYYAEIPDDKEIDILEFEEIIEGVLGEHLNEEDRLYLKRLVEADPDIVPIFSRTFVDYFQIGVKNGLVLIKKMIPPNKPVSNIRRSLFQLTREVVPRSFIQSSIGYPSKSCLKKKFKNNSADENENFELLHCATQTEIEAIQRFDTSEIVTRCVDFAKKKIFENYVHFDERELRLVERFFKEFTPVLIIRLDELSGQAKENLTKAETINKLEKRIEKANEEREKLQKSMELSLHKVDTEKKLALYDETIKEYKAKLAKSEEMCANSKTINQRLEDEIRILQNKEGTLKKLEDRVKNFESLENENIKLGKANQMHVENIAKLQKILEEKDEEFKRYKIMMNEMLTPPSGLIQPRSSSCSPSNYSPEIQTYLATFKKKLETAKRSYDIVEEDYQLLQNSELVKLCEKIEAGYQYRNYVIVMEAYWKTLNHNINVCERKGCVQDLKEVPENFLPPFNKQIQGMIDYLKEEKSKGAWLTVQSSRKKK